MGSDVQDTARNECKKGQGRADVHQSAKRRGKQRRGSAHVRAPEATTRRSQTGRTKDLGRQFDLARPLGLAGRTPRELPLVRADRAPDVGRQAGRATRADADRRAGRGRRKDVVEDGGKVGAEEADDEAVVEGRAPRVDRMCGPAEGRGAPTGSVPCRRRARGAKEGETHDFSDALSSLVLRSDLASDEASWPRREAKPVPGSSVTYRLSSSSKPRTLRRARAQRWTRSANHDSASAGKGEWREVSKRRERPGKDDRATHLRCGRPSARAGG